MQAVHQEFRSDNLVGVPVRDRRDIEQGIPRLTGENQDIRHGNPLGKKKLRPAVRQTVGYSRETGLQLRQGLFRSGHVDMAETVPPAAGGRDDDKYDIQDPFHGYVLQI